MEQLNRDSVTNVRILRGQFLIGAQHNYEHSITSIRNREFSYLNSFTICINSIEHVYRERRRSQIKDECHKFLEFVSFSKEPKSNEGKHFSKCTNDLIFHLLLE